MAIHLEKKSNSCPAQKNKKHTIKIKLNKKTAIYIAVFFIYASPVGPKLSGIGGGSLVVMEPLAAS